MLAWPDEADGRITIRLSTQMPTAVRGAMVEVAGETQSTPDSPTPTDRSTD